MTEDEWTPIAHMLADHIARSPEDFSNTTARLCLLAGRSVGLLATSKDDAVVGADILGRMLRHFAIETFIEEEAERKREAKP